MRSVGHHDTVVACRLYAAPEMLARVLHLPNAPTLIHVTDDDLGLEAVYRRVNETEALADYLLDHLA